MADRPASSEILDRAAGPGGPSGFAQLLKERTKSIHREAERAGFVADLIRGRATRDGYALFLRNLIPVYDALEQAIAASSDQPLVRPFADPGLRRLPRLTDDVATIAGADWSATLPMLPQAEAYAAAIRASLKEHGVRLAAHGYARYLGDLSGGQILKPLLARNLDLPAAALRFYDFPDVADVERPKDAVRLALDGVDPESATADALIEETIVAFRHNIAVSEAVAAHAAS